MPVLQNQRWERFARGLASGKTGDAAYIEAGYKRNKDNASRLKAKESISARVRELQDEKVERFVLSRQYVLDAVIENAEKALGRKPVKIGKLGEEREVFVYRGDVANMQYVSAGIELSMFTRKKKSITPPNYRGFLTSRRLELRS